MVCLKALGLHKANHDDHVLTRIIYDPNDIIEVEDEFKTVVGQRLIKGEIQKDLEYRVTEEELELIRNPTRKVIAKAKQSMEKSICQRCVKCHFKDVKPALSTYPSGKKILN